jgi:hypothetical protein
LTYLFARVSFQTHRRRGQSPEREPAHYAKDKGIKILKRTVLFHYAKRITLIALLCFAAFTLSVAQKPAPETDTKQAAKEGKPADPKAKPPYVLTVKTRPILNISLKAEKARISDVSQELSRRLKIPIFLGPERQNELITVEFSELTLEPALQLLSPSVYVDYEIDTGSSEPPKPLGIFLYDLNQAEPPTTAVVTGANQSMLIEGNTEDGVEPQGDEAKKKEEEQPLRITYDKQLLSVKAKKQPLTLVLLKIGEELGVPVDIQIQNNTEIDVEISKLPVEDVVRQLSPHIRLFLRADLTRAEKRALRMVLAEPHKETQ